MSMNNLNNNNNISNMNNNNGTPRNSAGHWKNSRKFNLHQGCTLKWVEEKSPDKLDISHIYSAIIYESRELKDWANTMTLFTTYLGPVIVASQDATVRANPAAISGKPKLTGSTLVKTILEGDGSIPLNSIDIQLIGYAISSMVRYSPSPEESNRVYMFYLQCQPPIRCDESVDTCLVSLIFKYNKSNDIEVKKKGLDLVNVALTRGIGLPEYQSISERNTRINYHTSILENVSSSILRLHNLRISEDGTKLIPITRPDSQTQSRNTNTGQQQQQSRQGMNQRESQTSWHRGQHESRSPTLGQSQWSMPHLDSKKESRYQKSSNQGQAPDSAKMNELRTVRSSQSQPQSQPQSQFQSQPQSPPQQIDQDRSTAGSLGSGQNRYNLGRSGVESRDPLMQRRSFGPTRTIQFVPASTNSTLPPHLPAEELGLDSQGSDPSASYSVSQKSPSDQQDVSSSISLQMERLELQ